MRAYATSVGPIGVHAANAHRALSSAHRPIGGTINDNEPSLFASLWRFKWYIVAAGILAAVAGYGLSMLQDELYQSEGQLLLNDPGSSGGVASEIGIVLDPGRYVRNQAEIIESPQVAAQASELLGGDPSASAIPAQPRRRPTTTSTQSGFARHNPPASWPQPSSTPSRLPTRMSSRKAFQRGSTARSRRSSSRSSTSSRESQRSMPNSPPNRAT